MSKLHKLNRKSSREHRDSARRILENIDKSNRSKKILKARLDNLSRQKVAVRFLSSFGPDLDAIDAFKKGENYQGFVGKGKNKRLKFEVKGNKLFLLGHNIATKTKDGIKVSNAGFDTGLTYATLKELGVNAKRTPGGKAILHNKEIDATSGEFVTVPNKEISPTPIRAGKPQKKTVRPNRTVTEQSAFREKVEEQAKKEQGRGEGELPLSELSIQPKDQRTINKITGVKTKIPKEIRATDAHHIFPVERAPGLRNNPSQGVMVTREQHRELHRLNPNKGFKKIGKIQKRLQKIAKPLDRSPEANEQRAFPLDKKEFAFFDEDFSNIGDDNERVAPVRVESFFKTPERDKRFKDISVPINRKRGSNFREGESPLGNVIEDKRVNRELFKKRGSRSTDNPFDDDVETFGEMFMRKFGPKGIEGPAGREIKVDRFSQGTLSLDEARKLAKLKSKLAAIDPRIRKKKKTGTIKRKIPTKVSMIQTAKMLSADAIVDAFIKSGIDVKGINGVYDPIQNRVLDATIPADKLRIQELFESKDAQIGFNSITDTRAGPNTDIELIRKQLKEIEARGGIPSLGFDEGSLEANDTVIGDTDTIMSRLLDNQRSTGIISPDKELEIRDNPRFKQ